MSAYGTIHRATVSAALLLPRTYLLPSPLTTRTESPSPILSPALSESSSSFELRLTNGNASNGPKLLEAEAMTIFPLVRSTVPEELLVYLSQVFNLVIEEGRTYPQKEVLSVKEFADYFFGQDCFIAISDTSSLNLITESIESKDGGIERTIYYTLEDLKGDRSWEECVLGMFYVKPNYPGRSSHNCNGGFVVPPISRGLKVGMHLGKAYLHFAPLLGYKASVFNLVYVNNIASCKIWDALGFNRIGLVPEAGCLKNAIAGGPDEYIDAYVYHKTFLSSGN